MATHSPIPSPTIPPATGAPGGLGAKIETMLVRFASRVVDAVKDVLAHVLRLGLQIFLEAIEPELNDMYGPMLRELADDPETPESLKHAINVATSGKYEAGAAILGFLGTSVGGSMIGNFMGVLLANPTYNLQRRIKPFRLPYEIARLVELRHPEAKNQWFGDMLDAGISQDRIPLLADVLAVRADLSSLGQLALRGNISRDAMVKELVTRGWIEQDAKNVSTLLDLIPGPNDLISLAVKEAWDDQFASIAGTDQGLPSEFVQWAGKQGLSADWCKRYWRAHWQLPSAGQGFEMLHRGLCTSAELDALLKALDISPFWRDKLKGITYNPYTRVDVRRLYNKNILKREDVKRNYLDLGYDDAHAENLTEFTVRDATGTDQEATKTDVLSGYSTGLLTKQETIDWLMDLDYPRDLAEFYISREDAKKANALKSKRIETVHKLYVSGDLTSAEASTRLTALGLLGNEITSYLDDWQIERDAKTKSPSVSQLETLLKQDLISEADYRAGLARDGYQQKYVDWLTSSVLAEKAAAADAAAKAQRAEQERLRTAKVKSDYAVAKSALDTQIAEAQVAIAESQVAFADVTAKYDADLAIAKGAVPEATLRANAAKDLASLQAQIDAANVLGKQLAEQVNSEQQNIADLNLQLAQHTEETKTALLTMTDESAIQAAKDELAAYTLNINTMVAQHKLTITQVQGDIAVNNTAIADLRAQQDEREEKLVSDLDIAARIKSVDELTSDYNHSKAVYAATLLTLRNKISDLNLQKAGLAETLQETIAKGG
jgi:hypothetical protein